jgi:hypothetical protein
MDVQRDDSQGGGARDRDVYPKSAFTPDSKSLITSYDGKLWRVSVPAGEAAEIPFTAKVEQQLGPLVKFDYPIDDNKLTLSQIRGVQLKGWRVLQRVVRIIHGWFHLRPREEVF